ncbi:MAG: hypothetical protein KGJ66_02140 [Alphaproteobacteria bacterium]|nr:hypothetical protein [Alphaproteobacteria bacterium]
MSEIALQKQPGPGRGPGRRFKSGKSGNPAGRPRGSRNRATMAAELLLDGEAELLTRKAIDLARKGDPVALKLCIERILPRRRERPVTIDLPPVNSAAELAGATTEVLDAIAAGALTPSEGQVVLAAYATARSIFETSELEARIRALEKGLVQK